MTAEWDGVLPETMALLLGTDPDDLREVAVGAGPLTVQVDSIECPVREPRKRRRLTGKRYRIARRRYARQMKAYRRGEIEPLHVRRVAYNVGLRSVERVPGSSSLSYEFGALPVGHDLPAAR